MRTIKSMTHDHTCPKCGRYYECTEQECDRLEKAKCYNCTEGKQLGRLAVIRKK